ncbi:uncharacterized protein LY79DRAFT_556893 [Colletotrichum navitas]|uniref:Uncharacterized protein n=1 Tax=Colletotrichum navitas TaxID=681940 RepID=A0AAD8PWU0_9PEZI|nr:uncharacterized protein LY79DRAFT_556893 [Colletotrichum navitas]KAK1586106.1 hypothetical protein LY79DRAFT_556893 [Colletotrichum navitas]
MPAVRSPSPKASASPLLAPVFLLFRVTLGRGGGGVARKCGRIGCEYRSRPFSLFVFFFFSCLLSLMPSMRRSSSRGAGCDTGSGEGDLQALVEMFRFLLISYNRSLTPPCLLADRR